MPEEIDLSCPEVTPAIPGTKDLSRHPRIAVVMPTTCSGPRKQLLHEATRSVLDQRGVAFQLLIVVNGSEVDADALAEAVRLSHVTVLQLPLGNVSLARLAGVKASSSDYIYFLDDDDKLLEGALQHRVKCLDATPQAAYLVTDGIVRFPGRDVRNLRNGMAKKVLDDPGAAFLERNCFDSPCATFRITSIGPAILPQDLHYYEWTWLLLKLISTGKRIAAIDQPAYLKREDNPLSVSKSRPYRLALPQFLDHALQLLLPPALRAGLVAIRVKALKDCGELALAAGEVGKACRYCFACLAAGGWRYAGPARRILAFSLRRTWP